VWGREAPTKDLQEQLSLECLIRRCIRGDFQLKRFLHYVERSEPALLSAILGMLVVIGWGNRSYTSSTDFGLHYALTQHISANFGWPRDVLPNLEEMSFYPAVTHTLGAITGYVTGSPITGMTTVAVLSVFGSYVAILSLVRFRSTAPTVLSAALFTIAIAVLRPFNIVVGGEIIQNFFYSQIVSFFIVLLIIQGAFSGRFPPLPLAIASIVITFGLGWVYPIATMQFACSALAYFGLATVRGLMSDRKVALLNGSLLCCLAVALPATFALHPTFELIKAIAAWPGEILLNIPPQKAPPILLLCGLPITAIAVVYLFGQLRVVRPLALVTTSIGMFGAALAQLLAIAIGVGTSYGVAKHLFPVVTVAAAASAVLAANAAAPWLNRRLQAYPAFAGVALRLAAFVAFAIVFSMPGRSLSPILRAQEFLSHNLPSDGVGRTVLLNDDLLTHEKFALALGDLNYPKKAGAVRIIGPDTVKGYYDPDKIMAAAPVTYTLINASQEKVLNEQCIIARSDTLVLVSMACQMLSTGD
jgi:hypothetical protein